MNNYYFLSLNQIKKNSSMFLKNKKESNYFSVVLTDIVISLMTSGCNARTPVNSPMFLIICFIVKSLAFKLSSELSFISFTNLLK